jgi:hypothetical protein
LEELMAVFTRWAMLIALVAACKGPQPAVLPKGGSPTFRRFALLVGASKDPDEHSRNPAPEQDVARIRDLLKKRYRFTAVEMHELVGTDATRQRLLAEFATAAANLDSSDIFVFYFSGHGMVLDDNYSLRDSEPGPFGPGPDQALRVLGGPGKYSLILDDEIATLMRRIKAKRRLFIVDACFSGDMPHLAAELSDDSASRAAIPKVASFSRKDPLLDWPSSFLSDGGDSTTDPLVGENDPEYAFASGTRLDESGYSFLNWPPPETSANSMFTYYLARQMAQSGNISTLAELVDQASQAIKQDRYCNKYGFCQQPVARGALKGVALQDLIDPAASNESRVSAHR